MLSSTITQKGQVTIPVEIRHDLDLHPGDKVTFQHENNKIVILKQKNDIKTAFGLYSIDREVTLTDIQKAIEEGPANDIS